MKKRLIGLILGFSILLSGGLVGCQNTKSSSTSPPEDKQSEQITVESKMDRPLGKTNLADPNFDISYKPRKNSYKIYCTYKNIHAWYDAIKAGIDDAVKDLAKQNVTIDYEWYGPATPDAVDQVNSIETAAGQGYDLIAVDVNQPDITAQAINDVVARGIPVAAFGTMDIENCNRAFFVGNADPYGDGANLAKEVCEQMQGKGKIALLAGTVGAAPHEERLRAFKDVIAKYPDVEIVDEQRDDDSVEKAISITESWLQAYPDLGGILCNNMSNPVGACQAVVDAGKGGQIVIGGMDHDLRALNYLKEDVLYVAQVQNCYDMGYKLIWNAIKTIDGEKVEEKTAVGSTAVHKDEADQFIEMLYGGAGK